MHAESSDRQMATSAIEMLLQLLGLAKMLLLISSHLGTAAAAAAAAVASAAATAAAAVYNGLVAGHPCQPWQ